MRGVRLVASALAAATLFIGGPAMAGSGDAKEVEMQDRCDPVSFDAALGAGACNPTDHTDVTFPALVDSLLANGEHPKWRFTREEFHVKPGGKIEVTNTGGEFHTFNLVASPDEPGCVPDINALIGRQGISTHCGEIIPGVTAAFTGGGFTVTAPTKPGTYHYICLIHPWMASEVTVRR